MIRVMLADDQALVRSAFAVMLGVEDDIEVVAQAADGAAAVELAASTRPDVILMDVRMPGMDGIEATARITKMCDARVVILTTFDSDDYLFDSLEAGASGFLLKNADPDQLVCGIRSVAAGHSLLAPEVTRRVIERRRPAVRPNQGIAKLSTREKEILVALAHGQSNAEIAADFQLSEATVKTHVSNVLTKLAVRDRVQAVIAAYDSGLVQAGTYCPGSP